MCASFEVKLKMKKRSDQPGQLSLMRIQMSAYVREQQEETKFKIQRCLREDDRLQVDDIFAKIDC
jgi:hypothetical protein